jgi:two-component system phosphate regulon sensor histidine kinase PhoR
MAELPLWLFAAGLAALVTALVTRKLVGEASARRADEGLRRASADAAAQRQAAELERDRLSSLVDELADGVLITGADERVRLANPAAEAILAAGPLAGRHVLDVVRDHEILDALARARGERDATAIVEREDPPRYIRVVARSVPGGETVLTMQDLSRIRRLETVRRDFVANVSHELRTPIASLKAMVEALEAGAMSDPAATKDFLVRMHGEVDDLAQLVTELLTLSRVESGEERPRPEAVEPIELVRPPVARLDALASRSSVSLEVEIPGTLPTVLADREKIGQVLTNLVHNAIKFTPAGGRVVVGAAPDDGVVRFEVRDTGVGIARDEVDRVFERFYKSERSRAGGGTGLGLAIARHIVHAHGGTIAATSAGPGRGTTFSFTLPVAGEVT